MAGGHPLRFSPRAVLVLEGSPATFGDWHALTNLLGLWVIWRGAWNGNAPPCVVFEDEHRWCRTKPAGLNTHAPGPFAGEGIYEWLRHREPLWAGLAIIHRLDKETSGVMVFGKTTAANRSLTDNSRRTPSANNTGCFTDRLVKAAAFTVVSLYWCAEKYLSQQSTPERARGNAISLTGYGSQQDFVDRGTGHRLHSPVRAQAAAEGFPILGDTTLWRHTGVAGLPALGNLDFAASETGAKCSLRRWWILMPTPVWLAHGITGPARNQCLSADSRRVLTLPGWQVERLGEFLLSQSEQPPDAAQTRRIAATDEAPSARAYHKILTQVR